MPPGVWLEGLSIEGYRSFGIEARQELGPLSKVHLLAGPNNSGKSNILAIVQRALPGVAGVAPMAFTDIDRPYGQPLQPLRVGLAKSIDESQLLERMQLSGTYQGQFLVALLRASDAWDEATGLLWVEFELQVSQKRASAWPIAPRAAEALTAKAEQDAGGQNSLSDLSLALANHGGGPRGEDARRVLERLVEVLSLRSPLPVQTIDAFRRISPGGGADDDGVGDLNGPGLIDRLARLQHPPVGQEGDRERFERINRFLGTLFDDDETSIEVPFDHQDLLVLHEGRRLPLASYGTGLHQAVILAAASTVLSEHLICVEEPEVHLHPTLQRKLLRYLREETDNQYLIATHSAHMLDAAQASISAVRQVDGRSAVAPALKPGEVAAIGAELGMRASDLVQANAVVWVEGPSDRVYLRAWLARVVPELKEGVHYSLVFYGGALLSYLSPDDPAVEEFISLPRVNRNFWVVIDSDLQAADQSLNATKARVRDALREQASPLTGAWVTAGYTIENYLPPELLLDAVRQVHPDSEPLWAGQQYVNPLGAAALEGRGSPADKAAVAQAVVDRWSEDTAWPLDLRERVDEVADMIRQANDH